MNRISHSGRNIFIALLLALFISLGLSVVSFNSVDGEAKSNRKVVNVVFVLDNTGSMSDEISNVKNNLSVFADYISSYDGIDEFRMALITYQDITSYYNGSYEDSVVYYSSSGSAWFTDVEEMKTTINNISLGYGGDGPETMYDGLGLLVDDLLGAGSSTIPFSSDAYKFAFVLTDADVKTDNYLGITGMDHMVSLLNQKNIYTSVVCPTSYKTYYQSLYEETGGTWININSSNFSNAMIEYAESILSIVQPDVVDLSFTVNEIYSFLPLAKEYGIDTDNAVYTSANTDLLIFDSEYKYISTALAEGTVYVTITDGDATLECCVTITEDEAEVPVEELALSIEVYVGVDQSVYIKAVALPESATEGGLNWYVGDTSVISIEETDNNTCLLKGISSGTTTITVITKDGGYSASTEVTVTVEPIISVEGVEISGASSEMEMTIGGEFSVSGSVLPADATNNGGFWYSSDSNIVEVTSVNGSVCSFKAVGCGTATIYFTSNEGGFTASISVNVAHNYSGKPYMMTDEKEIYLCENCGKAVEYSHSYVTETVAATCTESGTVTYTCAACGHSYVEKIEATGHSYVSKVTAATCTEAGYTTYTCEACGDSYVVDYVQAIGHSYVGKVTEATCTEAGYTTYTCEVCGDSYVVDYVQATGHSYVGKVTEATCTEAGYTTYTCEVCGDSYVVDYTQATGHSYVGKVTEATCTEAGYTTYTCEVCGHSYVEEIEATGHSYVSKVTEATCTEAGYTTYTCEVCGHSYVEEIEATGHSYVSKVTEATCTEAGYTTYTCEVCGDSYVGDYTQPISHISSDWIVDVEAAVGVEGHMYKECIQCGEILDEQVIEALADTSDENVDDNSDNSSDGESSFNNFIKKVFSGCGNLFMGGDNGGSGDLYLIFASFFVTIAMVFGLSALRKRRNK